MTASVAQTLNLKGNNYSANEEEEDEEEEGEEVN